MGRSSNSLGFLFSFFVFTLLIRSIAAEPQDCRRFSGNLSCGLSCVLIVTSVCCLCAIWVARLNANKTSKGRLKAGLKKVCGCSCSCGGVSKYSNGSAGERYEKRVERQSGASMMEQLVPEVTTHALSYLDYPSLCRLSMTNSSMRRAANDDSAWKALYQKDFTAEQDSVHPVNGWKAYYAATKSVININTEFYNIVKERSLPEMSRLWLHADYVKCVHGSGELFAGYDAVMQSWGRAFNWGRGGRAVSFQIRDVRVRVLTDMAWVTMKTYVDVDSGPFNVTNIYEFHNGQWFMVHHHSSVTLNDGDVGPHIF